MNNKQLSYNIEQKPEYHKLIDRTNMNWSVNTLIKYHQKDCLNFNAPYQRDLVWTLKQKRDYIMALFHHKAEIKPTLILDDDKDMLIGNLDLSHFIVLDGKQRLNTIIEFFEDKFSLVINDDEVNFSSLSDMDKRFFLGLDIKYVRISYLKKLKTVPMDIQFELFLEINALGTKQTDEHLENIANLKLNYENV